MPIYDAPVGYKPINFHSGLFSELRYMSNGLTFEILNFEILNFAKFSGLLPNDQIGSNNGYKISKQSLEN